MKMPRAKFVVLLQEVKIMSRLNVIHAIKHLRRHTDCGLKEAIHAVRKIQEMEMESIK